MSDAQTYYRQALPAAMRQVRYYAVEDADLLDDLRQEACVAAWQACAGYDPSKGSLINHVILCVRGALLHYWRDKAFLLKTIRGADGAYPKPDVVEMDEEFPARGYDLDLRLVLRVELDALPCEQASCLRLASEGYTCREIADLWGESVYTTENWLARGRKALRRSEGLMEAIGAR